jgi:hypothetical protein
MNEALHPIAAKLYEKQAAAAGAQPDGAQAAGPQGGPSAGPSGDGKKPGGDDVIDAEFKVKE